MIKNYSPIIISIAVVLFPVHINYFYAYGVQAIWRDYGDMKELVKDLRNGNKDDDNMRWNKYRDSTVYKNEKEDVRDCIDLANKVGGKLGDNEVVHCFENANYYREKYTHETGIVNGEDVGNQKVGHQDRRQGMNSANVTTIESAISVVNAPDRCDSSYQTFVLVLMLQ